MNEDLIKDKVIAQAVSKTSEVLLEGGLKPFPVSPYPDPLGVGLLADR